MVEEMPYSDKYSIFNEEDLSNTFEEETITEYFSDEENPLRL